MNSGGTSVLLVVDVQNDFCAGGALAVPDGDAVVRQINQMMAQFEHVVLTQDWHPPGHSSFASGHAGNEPFDVIQMPYGEQTLWPDHCVQGTSGAAFHGDLSTDPAQLVIRKGFRPAIDSYSAFSENDHATPTGLHGYLHEMEAKKLVIVGLAYDFCVFYSAMDASMLGFDVTVVTGACRAIDLNGSKDAATKAMLDAGIHLVESWP